MRRKDHPYLAGAIQERIADSGVAGISEDCGDCRDSIPEHVEPEKTEPWVAGGPRYYDAKLGEWVVGRPAWWATLRAAKGRTYIQTDDETPCDYIDKTVVDVERESARPNVTEANIEPRDRPERKSYGGYSGGTMPWTGLTRNKWPNTWWMLVQFYYSGEWHKDTKWVNDYKPEPYRSWEERYPRVSGSERGPYEAPFDLSKGYWHEGVWKPYKTENEYDV